MSKRNAQSAGEADWPRDAEVAAIASRPVVTDATGIIVSIATDASGKPLWPGWYVSGSTMMIGHSNAMKAVFQKARESASDSRPLWLHGGAGSGKYSLARQIHAAGRFKTGAFLAENCVSHRGAELNTVLFGKRFDRTEHVTSRVFRVAESNRWAQGVGGVVYLQMAEYIDVSTQMELVAAVTRGFYRGSSAVPVGGLKLIVSSVRDPEEMALAQRVHPEFKALFHVIKLPTLRERAEDIPMLVEYFLKLHGRKLVEKPKRPGPGVVDGLCKLKWPGNVRELEDACTQALRRAKGDFLALSDFVTTL